jgi:hypothetical protein
MLGCTSVEAMAASDAAVLGNPPLWGPSKMIDLMATSNPRQDPASMRGIELSNAQRAPLEGLPPSHLPPLLVGTVALLIVVPQPCYLRYRGPVNCGAVALLFEVSWLC